MICGNVLFFLHDEANHSVIITTPQTHVQFDSVSHGQSHDSLVTGSDVIMLVVEIMEQIM